MQKNSAFGWILAVVLGACSSPRLSEDAFSKARLDAAAAESAQSTLPKFRLLASANVNGETEPCGCAVNPKGGLDRRWNYAEEARKDAAKKSQAFFLADAGNAFLPGLRLDPSKADFFRARAYTLARGHARMGMKVHNVGAFDMGFGPDFLKTLGEDAGLQLISANWVKEGGERIFAPSVTVTEGSTTVTFIGVSDGRAELPIPGASVTDPAAAVDSVLKGVPVGHVVVILSDLGAAKDREVWNKVNRPVLVVGSRDLSSLEIPLLAGRALLVQPQLQGQQWADIEAAWRGDASGWYSADLATKFSERWERMRTRRKEGIDATEREQFAAVEADLVAYAPVALEKKAYYSYRLVDMTTTWFKPNALTREMAKVKN